MSNPTFEALLGKWLALRAQQRASRTKLGMVGYAYLAAMLADQPSTVAGLALRAQMRHVAAYRFVMTMWQLGEAHVSSWVLPPRSPALPVFSLGAGEDAPPPSARPNGRPVQRVNLPRKRLCPSVLAFVHLLRAIEQPMSRQEVCEATGLHNYTVKDALEALVQLQLAHIPLWLQRPQGGTPLAQYQRGPEKNAPMPKPKRAELLELHRRRGQRMRLLRRIDEAAALFMARTPNTSAVVHQALGDPA